MSLVVRDYQAAVITEAREKLRQHQSVLLQMPTGSGKTAVSAYMASSASKRGKKVMFLVHRKELLKQSAKTFDKTGIPYGFIASGFTGDYRQPVQIAGIATLANRMERYGVPDLVCVDEAHHSAAASWETVINYYRERGSKIVGLSATPERLDGTGLGRWFDAMVCGPTPAWLIEQGFLSPYRMFAPSIPDLSGIKKLGGDFNKGELEKRMGGIQIVGDVVKHYRDLAHGKKAMVFCVSIKHSLAVVEQFQKAGYRAAHIDGDSDNRDELIAAFEAGKIQVLSSVDLVSEGFDLPAIEVAILLRPTHSLSLFLQQVGRVLRPVYAPGYDLNTQQGRLDAIAAGPKPFALILDHSANSIPRDLGGRGHGLPDDEREWTLAGREKKKRGSSGEDEEAAVNTRQCPRCYRVHPPAPVCVGCGYEYPTMGRTVEQLEGELKEVDRQKSAEIIARKNEQARAKSLEDLVAIGKARNMKNPHGWAINVMRARGAKAERRYVR